MKLPLPVLPAIMVALLLHKEDSSPAVEHLKHPQLTLALAASTMVSSPVLSIGNLTPLAVSGTNFFWVTTNLFAPVPRLKGTNLTISGPPAPGVYKTEPFTCIVVVPGSNHDDRMIIGPANPDQRMSIVPRDLRFVPLSRK